VTPIAQILSEIVAQGLAAAGHAETPFPLPPVVPTQNPEHGDFQSNAAFRLGKALGTNPRALAETVLSGLPSHPAIRRAEVAGPGFLNFFLDESWMGERLAEAMNHAMLGVEARSGTVVVDYSSPNVAKRMHVGHLRSTVIGAALDRMHRFVGHRVVADNHIGDWGTQFGKLIVAWGLWLDEAALEEDALEELQRIYVKYAHEVEANPALEDRARAETAKLQAGDAENLALWRRFIDISLEEFERVYSRLGIRFDETLGESFYNPMLVPLVDDMLASGVAQVSEGAVVIPFDKEDGKGLGDTPMLVRKRDGAALYGTTDLATVRHRIDTWSPARILYVTDTRQQLHFRQLFAATRKLGWSEAELVHVWFGMLTLPEGAMSTRKGNVIRLVDVLDEAASRARAVVDEKSPDLPEEERAAIAEAVGVGAVRYSDLSQNPQSNVVFDWGRMLSLDGNTAPFLLYSFARCRSLQRKGGIEAPSVEAASAVEPLERALVMTLLRFPEALEGALDNYRPNLLCEYLFGLATSFNRFYYELPVLKAGEIERKRRLSLVEATARVLGSGLEMLGICPLDRM